MQQTKEIISAKETAHEPYMRPIAPELIPRA
eukprot:COSAG01_NODE_1136_length_11548_cov_30.375404_2_plen_31_part_00